MFETRISFSFSRLFRFRKSRAANTSEIAGTSYSGPSSRRPISSQPEPINVSSTPSPPRRPLYFSPLQNPAAQPSLPTSPAVTSPVGTPPPIIIIGRDPYDPEPTDPLPPVPAPPGDIGLEIPSSGVSLLPSPPAPKKRCVSFQLPIRDLEEDERPSTPLSTCSTLVSESGGGEPAPAVSRDYPDAFSARDPGAGGLVARARDGAELAAEFLTVPGAVRSGTVKARRKSLFAPQPVRVDMSRFSLPISPAAPMGRPESRRTSMIPAEAGSSITSKKEKRTSRWSREMNKPETQEVLRALSRF